MLVAADASVIANFAVAAGTAALAVGTFVLALSARKQARDTRRLAEASERQVAWMGHQVAATMPRLRIVDRDRGGPAVSVSKGRLRAVYRNHGSVPAQVLEVGSEDAGGFAETDPVRPGDTTVINMPAPLMDYGGPDWRIRIRYRSLHGGPDLVLWTDLLTPSGGSGWTLIAEHEPEES